jgi:hypothetical protein
MVFSNQRRNDTHSNHRVDENVKGDLVFQSTLSGACGQADKPVVYQFRAVAVSLVYTGIVGYDVIGNGVDEKAKVVKSQLLRPQVLAVRRTSLLHIDTFQP